MMLRHADIQALLKSPKFEQMMVTVGKDDLMSFRNNNEWIFTDVKNALIFSSPASTWKSIYGPN